MKLVCNLSLSCISDWQWLEWLIAAAAAGFFCFYCILIAWFIVHAFDGLAEREAALNERAKRRERAINGVES